jgi:formylglycine-generating enzyme required for sulfatase activity
MRGIEPSALWAAFRTVTVVGVLVAIAVAAALLGVSVVRRQNDGRSAPPRRDLVPASSRINNSIGVELVWIPPGEFLMGSPQVENGRFDDEGPRHRVTLTKGFYLSVCEITQYHWKLVMENNPSYFKGDFLPVECVSWDDAVEFCRRLSAREGVEYRLPTEAEWEYACRGGTASPYSFGHWGSVREYTRPYGQPTLDEYAWFVDNSDMKTHPVGRKRPNAFGLYDMHGNVEEWCQDWHGDYLSEPVTDPVGPATGDGRVHRGGSWSNMDCFCRSAYRLIHNSSDWRVDDIGFRIARTAPSHHSDTWR